jgi:thiamine-phosphate pyrophosphorylase
MQLPIFIFMTDSSRIAAPVRVIAKLPSNSMVIIRDYDIENREKYAKNIAIECRKHNIPFLIAGDYNLARKLKANGIHLPEYCGYKSYQIRKKQPKWIITTAAHSEKTISKLANYPIDAAILSPILPTKSHIGRKSLGILSFRKICNKYPVNIYALGGINYENIPQFKSCKIEGIAGVGIFDG